MAQSELQPMRPPHSQGLSLLQFDREQILRVAQSVDVVSFDVFDTILHRTAMNPTDLFGLMETRFGHPGFKKKRICAERQARVKFRGPSGGETCLNEIYEVLGPQIGESTRQQELDLEKRLIFPNPYVADLIIELKSLGKRVIAVSDMYLFSSEISQLLTAHGVAVDKVYSSADYRDHDIGKYNGKMFDAVLESEAVTAEKLLHVGDNPVSDVQHAQTAGLLAIGASHPVTKLISSRQDFALIHKAQKNATGSLVAGIVQRSHLASECRPIDLKNFGYDFGGPLVTGFVHFIRERCLTEEISHLVLLARDGYVVRDVLDELGAEGLSYRVVSASRRMTVFPRFVEEGFEAILGLFRGHPGNLSKRQVLDILDLRHLAKNLKDADISMPLRSALTELEPLLMKQAVAERDALLAQYREEQELVSSGKKFAWVDVGWALSSITSLHKILGFEMPGFFIGSSHEADNQQGLEGYLFTLGKPKHVSQTIMAAPEPIELIFSDVVPSTSRFEKIGEFVSSKLVEKSTHETVRDIAIRQVREGVTAFAKDFSKFQDLVVSEELREYNRNVWEKLISECPTELKVSLRAVPHDRLGASSQWKTIGDHWTDADGSSFVNQVTVIVERTLRPFPPLYRFAQAAKNKLLSS